MSIVRVAVPLSRTSSQLTLNIGRPWSVIEHLILEATVRAPQSIGELEEGFCIPRQVIESSLIRLMRVEWIFMQPTAPIRFATTPFGVRACVADRLPHVGKQVVRARSQLVERLTGHVFRKSELQYVHRADLVSEPGQPNIKILQPRLDQGMFCADEIVEVALEDNEELVSIDSTPDHWPNRFALFEVSESHISGLPKDRPLDDLRAILLREARLFNPKQAARARHADQEAPSDPVWHRINFESADILVGGPQHGHALASILSCAKTHVVIHSTFLDPERFRDLIPSMIQAVKKRGIKIDILWGQEPPDDLASPDQNPRRRRLNAQEAAEELRKDPRVSAYSDRLRIHARSTHSHAKVIVADVAQKGQYIALVGSCNWLSSPFKSIEASIYLREPGIVRDVIQCLMRLCFTSAGGWEGLAGDLLAMRQRLRDQRASTLLNARATLVIGEAHNTQVLRARDKARRSILLTSNRLGRFFRPGALMPLAQACAPRTMQARIFYSLLQGIRRADESQFMRDAAARNIRLRPIRNPKVHAKILAWDENSAVITSQNWLSADPGPCTLATELGVAVEAPWIAKILRERFDVCLREGRHQSRNRRGKDPRRGAPTVRSPK
jgi:phosphatidylserine/phosphatidylglycerophosphate/cardiolipin synthase-like enzyme